MAEQFTRRDEMLIALVDYRGPQTLCDFWLHFQACQGKRLSYGRFMQLVAKLKREGRIAYANGFIYERQQAT